MPALILSIAWAALIVVCAVVIITALRKAPMGYEDVYGFHYGQPPQR